MADKGTSTDIASNVAVSTANDNFSIDTHLIALMWSEPFFSSVLRGIEKIKTRAIPTAGVLAKNGDVKMWWNPDFLASLTSPQIKGLFKHECYHLVFEHTTTRRRDPHVIWNYATDLAINSLIDEVELPEGGLIPGKAFKTLTKEQKDQMGPKAVERYNKVSKTVASFPKGQSSEWYFQRLMEDPEVKEAIESSEKTKGKSLSDALADGDVKVDENGNLVDKDGNPVTVMPGNGMDDHDGWDQLSDEEREMVKGKVKQALAKAVEDCDKTGQWGSVSSEMRGQLRSLIRKEISWQAVLKRFCGFSRRANRRTNNKRLHRKYPGIHPGYLKSYTSSIAVYIDQSGSVGNAELEILFGELRNLAGLVEFTTFHFDTAVDEKSEEVWRKGKTPQAHRTRCGGTCFTAPSVHANKNSKRFDGYLILTDGYAADPGPSRLRRGWVITPGGQYSFGKSKDFVINLKGN